MAPKTFRLPGLTCAFPVPHQDVTGVVVIVSRWFGGIHLGADRFKHINAAARDALMVGGFLPEKDRSKKKR